MFFHTAIARIYFSKEIYNTIVYNYFNDLIMSKNCADVVGGTNGNFLRCDSKILSRSKSKVTLVFDHMKITFPLIHFFYLESDHYISTFYMSNMTIMIASSDIDLSMLSITLCLTMKQKTFNSIVTRFTLKCFRICQLS